MWKRRELGKPTICGRDGLSWDVFGIDQHWPGSVSGGSWMLRVVLR